MDHRQRVTHRLGQLADVGRAGYVDRLGSLDLLGAPRGDFVPYLSTRVSVRKTGAYRKLASVAGVPRQLGRGIAEAISLAAALAEDGEAVVHVVQRGLAGVPAAPLIELKPTAGIVRRS